MALDLGVEHNEEMIIKLRPNVLNMPKIKLSDEQMMILSEGIRPQEIYCRVALEYMAMMPKQKTWFLLNNPRPHIPSHYGPKNVSNRTGTMYEMLVRKWARHLLKVQAI